MLIYIIQWMRQEFILTIMQKIHKKYTQILLIYDTVADTY
jgi:hypothetical protein